MAQTLGVSVLTVESPSSVVADEVVFINKPEPGFPCLCCCLTNRVSIQFCSPCSPACSLWLLRPTQAGRLPET